VSVDHWHLASIDWLRDLPRLERERLLGGALIRRYPAGATIFEPEPRPERVFILEEGLVRLYRISSDGDELTLGYVHPGEVFGELAAFVDQPRESFAAAVENSTALEISRETCLRIARASPSAGTAITAQIGGRLKQIEARAEDLAFRTVQQRVAHILLQLSGEFGQPVSRSVRITLRLTHAQLAALVGASRPTVSLALGQLEEAGLIVREDGNWIILDRSGLERIVERLPEADALPG